MFIVFHLSFAAFAAFVAFEAFTLGSCLALDQAAELVVEDFGLVDLLLALTVNLLI